MTDRASRPTGRPDRTVERDRAVSELIGFVLVFSLVVAVVGIVSVGGVDSLRDARDAEQAANAERAMEVLADNVADLYQRGAPSRATEISLENAQMYMDGPIEVRVENTGSPSFSKEFTLRPVVYEGVDDTRLVYVMGSVFRVQRNGEVVLREWSPVVDENYVSFPVVNTTSTTGNSQALQSSTVLVRTNTKKRKIVEANTTSDYDSLEIRIETPRNDLWKAMLEDRPGFDSCSTSPSPASVECDVTREPRTFYLVETRIAVAIKP